MSNNARGIRQWVLRELDKTADNFNEVLATGNYLGRVYTKGDKDHAKLAAQDIFERNTKHVTAQVKALILEGEIEPDGLIKAVKARAYTLDESFELAIGTTQDYIVTSKGNTMHV